MIAKTLTENMPSTEDVLHALGLQYERTVGSFFAIVAAFAVGAFTGAVVAMLATPRSGPEVRRALGERVSELGSQVSERLGTRSAGAS